MSRRDTGDCRVYSWAAAYAYARAFAMLDGHRMRVVGYPTGLARQPWGYSIERAK